MSKKFIGLLMLVAFLFSFSTKAFALATQKPEIQPCYSYTTNVNTLISTSGNKVDCTTTLRGKPNITTKVKITMTLEKKVLFWWSEKETWTQTFNSYNGTLSKTYIDADSGTYRISAEYVAYSGTKSETITDTSAEVKV